MASDPSRLAGTICLATIIYTTLFAPANTWCDERVWDSPPIDRVDQVMFLDPLFVTPNANFVITNEPLTLWKQALARSDAQLQRVTIDTIVLAHRRGMKGLEEMVPVLAELLSQSDLDAEVQRAAVNALIQLDARDHAEQLAEYSTQHGAMIGALVEPALAKWKSTALADQWLKRLNGSGAGRISMIHAIDGVGAIGRDDASPLLERFVFDRSLPSSVRIASANALGAIHSVGWNEQAAKLAGQSQADPIAGLLALRLLQRHNDAAAITTLKLLAGNEITAVQAGALGRLFEIDPELVDELAEQAIVSRDVNVRRWGARALISKKSAARIAPLSTLLDDVNPDLRRGVAAALVQLAREDGLQDEVIKQATAVLEADEWRGCEQATIVLVNLDHRPASNRFVDLMNHPRDEVMITSAWGLRRFAMKEHLPAMLDQAKLTYEGFRAGRLNARVKGPEEKVAQLFMAFGQMRYHEADELMRQYLPKDHSLGWSSRPAAAWAIGLLHEELATEDLTSVLLERYNDSMTEPLETAYMRTMCAVSFGRMKSQSTLPHLRKNAFVNGGPIGLASLWAIEQMTGEKSPTPLSPTVTYNDWFLTPLRDGQSDE